MVRTRSRKARDTQWTRDAVLNNPDLLCNIAEQANLPTACKLLTTSKRNFIGGAEFFKKQYHYYDKLQVSNLTEETKLSDLLSTFRDLDIDEDEQQSVEYKVLNSDHKAAFEEYRINLDRFFSVKAYLRHLAHKWVYCGPKDKFCMKCGFYWGICGDLDDERNQWKVREINKDARETAILISWGRRPPLRPTARP